MSLKKCRMRPVDGSHDPIILEDNTPVNIGRGPKTRIKDSRCSRNQVVLVANFAEDQVKVTQLGRNSCGLNGVEMKKDKPVNILHGEKLDILLGQYTYVIEFYYTPTKIEFEPKRSSALNDVSDSDDDFVPPPKQSRLTTTTKGLTGSELKVSTELWETVGSELLVYKHPQWIKSNKVAGFDLDGTIITTQSGTAFPKHPNDWKIQYPEILMKLDKLHREGYKIVFFTNQASLNNSPHTAAQIRAFQFKIESIVKKLKTPIEVYVAKSKGLVRKPCTGMWSAMEVRNGKININLAESFYCGDAAGRVASRNLKTDFSQADILFAKNLGLKFYTPEELFLGKKNMRKILITAFDYKSLPQDIPLCDPENKVIHAIRPELVLLVGCPGSGKTTFALTHMVPDGYKRINRDELKTMDRCLSETAALLQRKMHVVVDNTNPTIAARAKFIEIATKLGIATRIFIMNTSLKHAQHNNRFRQLTDRTHDIIGDAVLNSFFQAYEEPRADEVSEIVRINFWPISKDPELDHLYQQYLCEK